MVLKLIQVINYTGEHPETWAKIKTACTWILRAFMFAIIIGIFKVFGGL